MPGACPSAAVVVVAAGGLVCFLVQRLAIAFGVAAADSEATVETTNVM